MSWFRRNTPQYMTLNPDPQRPSAGEAVEPFSDHESMNRDRIPADMWHKCPTCNHICLKKDLIANLRICVTCGRHERMPAMDRIELLVDPGSFTEEHANLTSGDPLGFEDKRKYRDYVKQSRAKTGRNDAVVIGTATMGGVPVSLAVMEFAFMGGSMGSVVGEKVTRAMERALADQMPCIVVVSTGGARMQEGILSLMQMAKTSLLCHRLDQARVPFLVLLADPSTAGVMASYASLGDLILAEPNAYIGFAGRRVIEKTIGINQQLPANFQTAEFQQEKGFVDMVVKRSELRETFIRVLKHLTKDGSGNGNGRKAKAAKK